MKFKIYLEQMFPKCRIKKKTRKTLMTGRKQAKIFNPRLNIPIVGMDTHSKLNRDRRYVRREKREGIF